MQTVLIVIHLMIVLALVGVVLIQRSEGGGLGIGGGSGFMSARGTANALTRTTAILAALFFITSLGLGILTRYRGQPDRYSRPHPGNEWAGQRHSRFARRRHSAAAREPACRQRRSERRRSRSRRSGADGDRTCDAAGPGNACASGSPGTKRNRRPNGTIARSTK